MKKTMYERILERVVPGTICAIVWMGWGHSVYTLGVGLPMA